MAVRDLKAVGIDVAKYRPMFSSEIVERRFKDDAYGFADDETGAIFLREDMELAMTYKIYVHEAGHVLGLSHTKSGIMAPTHRETLTGGPTPRQRKLWCSELARLVTRHRIRKFVPA
jgi:hypothetical protein